MDLSFSSRLARTRLRHRVSELPDGALAYRVEDGTGFVRLTQREWAETGQFFDDNIRKSARNARIAMFLWLPAYVTYIAICSTLIPREWARALPSWLYFVVFIGPLPGTPIAIYLRHSYHVKKVSKAIDAALGVRPRAAEPPKDPFRPPFWLDLLCLLFVGPGLVVAVIGELAPQAFRNTPLSGRHIDWQAMVGFALFALWLGWSAVARYHARTLARQRYG